MLLTSVTLKRYFVLEEVIYPEPPIVGCNVDYSQVHGPTIQHKPDFGNETKSKTPPKVLGGGFKLLANNN